MTLDDVRRQVLPECPDTFAAWRSVRTDGPRILGKTKEKSQFVLHGPHRLIVTIAPALVYLSYPQVRPIRASPRPNCWPGFEEKTLPMGALGFNGDAPTRPEAVGDWLADLVLEHTIRMRVLDWALRVLASRYGKAGDTVYVNTQSNPSKSDWTFRIPGRDTGIIDPAFARPFFMARKHVFVWIDPEFQPLKALHGLYSTDFPVVLPASAHQFLTLRRIGASLPEVLQHALEAWSM